MKCTRNDESKGELATGFSISVSDSVASEVSNVFSEVDRKIQENLEEYVVQLITPISDYNEALATELIDLIQEMLREGKYSTAISEAVRTKVFDFLDNESVVLEWLGEHSSSFPPKKYADLLARSISSSIRNEGYVQRMQHMGVADGWMWDGVDDESTCELCHKEIQSRRVRSWDEPRPPFHLGCRCRPVSHVNPKTKQEIKERIAALKVQKEKDDKMVQDEKDELVDKASSGWKKRLRCWLGH